MNAPDKVLEPIDLFCRKDALAEVSFVDFSARELALRFLFRVYSPYVKEKDPR
jgi:hypothetical protein